MKPKTFDKEQVELLAFWIAERERMRVKKEKGEPKPWTEDLILRNNRFCCPRRAEDKVSIWLLENWYGSDRTRGLVVAAALARMINWPDSLSLITGGKKFTLAHWDPAAIIKNLQRYADGKNKVFTGAYIINGARGGSKIKQVIENVDFIFNAQEPIVTANSMELTHAKLMNFHGVGSFIAGQIVADLRFTKAMNPDDVMSWAPLGPGSKRGIRKLMGMEASGAMNQNEFNDLLPQLIARLQQLKRLDHIMPRLEAMDVQNCLCEYDKYTRLQRGEGSVRSKYPGEAETADLLEKEE